MVGNLWKGFVTAFVCMLIHSFFSYSKYIVLFGQTNFHQISFEKEIFMFALLGLVCGLLGSFFIIC
jgi:H+/Cl- antiporter ClcA